MTSLGSYMLSLPASDLILRPLISWLSALELLPSLDPSASSFTLKHHFFYKTVSFFFWIFTITTNSTLSKYWAINMSLRILYYLFLLFILIPQIKLGMTEFHISTAITLTHT